MIDYSQSQIVVSVSGGKDSSAMCLNLFEQGYSKNDFIRVFADTGWEDASTYEYLEYLEKTIGNIERIKAQIEINEEFRESIEKIESLLGFESPMIRQAYQFKFMSNVFNKWCTVILKMQPFKKFFDNLDADPVNLVGIRRDESARRSRMTEWEFNSNFDCWTHRPIIDWTEQQVIDIHHRFNLIPNRLYLNGWNRVGCYPCIFSRKEEIRRISEKRIQIIEIMEKDLQASFFKPKNDHTATIRQVVEWSKTARGGKQFMLFDTEKPTCEKWGLCGI